MKKVLVCIPARPTLNKILRARCEELAGRIAGANPSFEVRILIDESEVKLQPDDYLKWSKIAKARNQLLSSVSLSDWDYLFWIDADVVDYPLDIVTKLIERNPRGIRYGDDLVFSDHFSICKAALEAGRPVTCHRDLIAFHADLTPGNYPPEQWH